jgi:hypothetical protein
MALMSQGEEGLAVRHFGWVYTRSCTKLHLRHVRWRDEPSSSTDSNSVDGSTEPTTTGCAKTIKAAVGNWKYARMSTAAADFARRQDIPFDTYCDFLKYVNTNLFFASRHNISFIFAISYLY